jgi:hypothetical protein
MTAINLVPPGVLSQREARRRLRRWVWRLGLVVALLAPAYAGLARLAQARRAEADRLTGTYTLLQERLKSAEGLIQERDRLAVRRSVVERMRGGQPAATYLEVLGQALTADSYVNLISLERCDPGEPEAAPDGSGVRAACRPTLRLHGRAPGNRQVGEILRELGAAPELRDVALVSVSDPSVLEGPAEVEFELLCTLADGAAPGRAVTP